MTPGVPGSSVTTNRTSRIPGWRAATAIAVAVFLVATGTLAGNAYWSALAAKDATATAATVATTSAGAGALSVTYKQGFAPGGAVIAASLLAATAPVTINNTGATPLNYSVTVSGGSAAVTLQLWKRGATCDASTAVPATATSGTLAAPPSMPADAASAVAGASILLCARTTLTGAFSDLVGATITPTITFTGRVGDNWSASSGTAFTQAASYNWFRVNHSASGKCLDANGASTAIGTSMILYPCKSPNSSDNQSFRFEPVGGSYRIYIGNGTGNGPVVAPTANLDNSTVQLATKTTTAGALLDRQLWSIVADGTAGDYLFVNVESSRCLELTSEVTLTVFTVSKCSTKKKDYDSQHFSFTEIP